MEGAPWTSGGVRAWPQPPWDSGGAGGRGGAEPPRWLGMDAKCSPSCGYCFAEMTVPTARSAPRSPTEPHGLGVTGTSTQRCLQSSNH